MAKSKVHHGNPPVVHRKVTNSDGFRKLPLGNDTKPGPDTGAPLVDSQHVDDGNVQRGRWVSGNPYNRSTGGQPGHVLGNLNRDAPIHGGPVRGHGQQPDRRGVSKASEVAAAKRQARAR